MPSYKCVNQEAVHKIYVALFCGFTLSHFDDIINVYSKSLHEVKMT